MNNKYLIGDAEKILHLSKDTLRYYDKIGLVSPHKDPVTGYRYYSLEDLITLTYVLGLKELNFPLAEIKSLITNSTLDGFNTLLEKQECLIDQKIESLLKLKKTLHDYKQGIEVTKTHLNQLELTTSPAFVYQPIVSEFDPNYASIITKMHYYLSSCSF